MWLRYSDLCTKSFVGWSFARDPTGGAYSAPQTPMAGLGVGPRGKGRREGGQKEVGDGGKGGYRRGREGRESRNALIQSWQAYASRPFLEFSLPRLGLELSASASPRLRTLLPCLASASTSLPRPLPLPRQNCLEPIPALSFN